MAASSQPTVDFEGTKWWKNEKGELHREGDLPAIIYKSGTQMWFLNDRLHRGFGLPAHIDASGTKRWAEGGRLHRLCGAAVELCNGTKQYFVDGVQYTEQEHPAAVTSYLARE